MFITFIFKLSNETYYGKYLTDNISPDHEGLDEVIKPYLLKALNEHQLVENVNIGIISVCCFTSVELHSTDEERYCFDFYCENFNINYTQCLEMYLFGKRVNGQI